MGQKHLQNPVYKAKKILADVISQRLVFPTDVQCSAGCAPPPDNNLSALSK